LDFNLPIKVTLPKLRSRTSNPPRQLAEINVIPLIGIHDPVVTLSEEARICPVGIPNLSFRRQKNETIKPANDKILITVKTFVEF
jgi:hypothetical protein